MYQEDMTTRRMSKIALRGNPLKDTAGTRVIVDDE
jgi:hypothetical protein